MLLTFIIVCIFAGTMLAAACKDAATMKIPNWISLALIAGFVVVQPFLFQGWDILATHLMVGGVFFLTGFAMFAFGWLGGGDAKLMAATALWWQWPDAITYISFTTLIGAALGIVLLIRSKFLPIRILTSQIPLAMFKEERNMPYGLALAAGALLTLPKSHIFLASLGL